MLEKAAAVSPGRERLAQCLFEPKSVAILGASRNPVKFGNHLVAILAAHGFQGDIYPLNPIAQEIAGIRCYPDLASLPGPCDLVVIALPASEVLAAFESCIAHDVGAVVIVSSGFSEVGDAGRLLEAQLVQASRRSGLPFIGPNCEGFVNNPSSLFAVIAGAMFEVPARPGGVSLVAHSGAYTGYAYSEIAYQGVGIAKAVSSGNEAVLGLPELLALLDGDDQTKAVLLHLEGVRDAQRFRAAASRLALHKPLVINHVGRHPRSAVVASTHTAALAAPGRTLDAYYRQCGAVVTKNLEEMVDATVALATYVPPAGDRVAVISFSGGMRVEMVDLLVESGFDVPDFSRETELRLAEFIPGHGSRCNPVDMADGLLRDPACAAKSMRAAADDENIDVIVVLLTVTRNLDIARSVIAAAGDVAGKPVLLACTSQKVSAPAVALMRDAGIPVFSSLQRVDNALRALRTRRHALVRLREEACDA
jgi:acyl-CoA synthetase (NDP forming)